MKAGLIDVDPEHIAAVWLEQASEAGLRHPASAEAAQAVARWILPPLADFLASSQDDSAAAVEPLLPLLWEAPGVGSQTASLAEYVRGLQVLERVVLQAALDRSPSESDRERVRRFFNELVARATECWARAWQQREEALTQAIVALQDRAQHEDTAQNELLDTLDDLQTVLNATINGIVIVDPHGRIRYVNQRLGEIFGIDVAGLPGTEAITMLLPRIRERCGDPEGYDARSRYIYEHLEEETQDEVQTSEPDTRTVLRYGGPIRASDGRLLGRVQVYTDVTAQRRAERVRDEFLSVAAHELKTPITSLKGYAQLLLRAADRGSLALEPAKLSERLGAILRQVDRLTNLVDDLLEVARIQSGRMQLRVEMMNLDELGQGVVERFAGDAAISGGHRIELRTARRPLIGAWDPDRLEQVMTNLLSNAIKYSPAGGVIRVRLTRHADMAKVSVSDQGIGIPAADVAKLFQPFARAANASVSSLGGIGLGLFISRDIIERHGGQIWVESHEGKGSTFHFTLPLRRR